MHRGLLLGLAVTLATANAANGETAPALSVSPVQAPLAAGGDAKLGPLRFRGGVMLSSPGPKFRGFSGLWVSRDGARFATVEGGGWTSGRLRYDAEGNLNGLTQTASGLLRDAAGQPFQAEEDKDAEALDFDGAEFLVGFETHNRVVAYRSLGGPGRPIDLPPPALEGIGPGTGFSSVAALPKGARIFLPEYTYADPKVPSLGPAKTRAWLITPAAAGPVWLRESFMWLPVSLAALPNGDLLLLELRFAGSAPITHTRISRIAAKDIAIGATMPAEELAIIAPPLAAPRLEASSVRVGPRGETLVYLLSNEGPAALYMFELGP